MSFPHRPGYKEFVDSMINDIGDDASEEDARLWLYNEIMSSVRLRLEGDRTVDINLTVDSARAVLQNVASDVGEPELKNLINDFWVEAR